MPTDDPILIVFINDSLRYIYLGSLSFVVSLSIALVRLSLSKFIEREIRRERKVSSVAEFIITEMLIILCFTLPWKVYIMVVVISAGHTPESETFRFPNPPSSSPSPRYISPLSSQYGAQLPCPLILHRTFKGEIFLTSIFVSH
jgi:hypothetical protein